MWFPPQGEGRTRNGAADSWIQSLTPKSRDSQRKCIRHNRPARRYINLPKSLLASFPAGVESDL